MLHPRPSTPFPSARSGPPSSSKPPRSPGVSRGIGRLAKLIVEHPDQTYRHIAEEVNAQIEGARASQKSVRWYVSQMRRRGEDIANRKKNLD